MHEYTAQAIVFPLGWTRREEEDTIVAVFVF